MLLSEFFGGSGVIPTISSWQELPSNFQYVEPMVIAICWSNPTSLQLVLATLSHKFILQRTKENSYLRLNNIIFIA